ncbi:hypothetical protein N665_0532s0040 [Sinapis alba]|nr:hypothetical protein N665_0532s0040 [Sinapis alba]
MEHRVVVSRALKGSVKVTRYHRTSSSLLWRVYRAFYSIGLHMNETKTELFTSGLDQSESDAIVSYGFPSGNFPIRSFHSWTAKLLSFAGRLQLLKSVIFGTVNFWLSAFILPKGCIKSIESLCSRFLWSGNVEQRGIAKIAWSTVCLPKDEGGLGLRSFAIWSQVLCVKFIWTLLSTSPSLWADWHWNCHLHNKSFWTVKATSIDSWIWSKLLNLRPLALNFCKFIVGNGTSTSFWFDVWTPFGKLINYLGPNGPRALTIRKNAMVAHATSGSRWALPHPRSQRELDLHVHLTTLSLPLTFDIDDTCIWKTCDGSSCVFNAALTWEAIRPRQARKEWVDIVWFKGAVPKQSFNMWIANYDRLPTRTRLAGWGLPISNTCGFCTTVDETRDHLMLACQYSQVVWKEVFDRCRSRPSAFTNWTELLSWIREPVSRRLKLLRKLAAHSVILNLWKQRNNLLHNHISIPPAIIFHCIDREVRNIISARRARKHYRSLMKLWLR